MENENETETMTEPIILTEDEKRRAYMREYMRKRYSENKEKCRAYKNSVKCKITHKLPPAELKEYGMYLADIYRLRKIKEKLPTELFEKIVAGNA